MENNLFESFKEKLHINNNSKLSIYFNNNECITECKQLNNYSAQFFILLLLDILINEEYFTKEEILNMLNECL